LDDRYKILSAIEGKQPIIVFYDKEISVRNKRKLLKEKKRLSLIKPEGLQAAEPATATEGNTPMVVEHPKKEKGLDSQLSAADTIELPSQPAPIA